MNIEKLRDLNVMNPSLFNEYFGSMQMQSENTHLRVYNLPGTVPGIMGHANKFRTWFQYS